MSTHWVLTEPLRIMSGHVDGSFYRKVSLFCIWVCKFQTTAVCRTMSWNKTGDETWNVVCNMNVQCALHANAFSPRLSIIKNQLSWIRIPNELGQCDWLKFDGEYWPVLLVSTTGLVDRASRHAPRETRAVRGDAAEEVLMKFIKSYERSKMNHKQDHWHSPLASWSVENLNLRILT